jgi:glycosyltransferase involved in cell wall biosynthesis
MKIAIDYTLAEGHIGGMGVLIRNLADKIGKIDKNNKYILIRNPYNFETKNIFTKIFSVLKQHIWYQTNFSAELKKQNVDLLFSPNPPVPLLFNKPIILIIPDIAFYFEPSLSFLTKLYLLINYISAANKAKLIITISEYSKNDIVKRLKIDKNKIVILPLAASDDFRQNKVGSEVKDTLNRYHINKPFILCDPGTFIRRKNVKDLITSFSKLPPAVKNSLCIVLVGKNIGMEYDNLKSYIDHLKLSKSVIFTGYLDKKELINVYTAAKIHVYPSLYEGFGLPPLQAMKMSIPSIVYNRSSLPEVVGTAGIIVNDPDELSKAICLLMTNDKIYKRYVKKGKLRSNNFSWDLSALKLKKIIGSV